jgi:hypothetical protein
MKKLFIILMSVLFIQGYSYSAQPYITYNARFSDMVLSSFGIGFRKKSDDIACDCSLELSTDILRYAGKIKLLGLYYFPTEQKISGYVFAGVEGRLEKYNNYFFTSSTPFYFVSPTIGFGFEKSKNRSFSKFIDLQYVNYSRCISETYHNRNRSLSLRLGLKV